MRRLIGPSRESRCGSLVSFDRNLSIVDTARTSIRLMGFNVANRWRVDKEPSALRDAATAGQVPTESRTR